MGLRAALDPPVLLGGGDAPEVFEQRGGRAGLVYGESLLAHRLGERRLPPRDARHPRELAAAALSSCPGSDAAGASPAALSLLLLLETTTPAATAAPMTPIPTRA